jgi:hypothetical protein
VGGGGGLTLVLLILITQPQAGEMGAQCGGEGWGDREERGVAYSR